MRIILKHNYYLIWFWILTPNFAQDTFSIVAVDTNTMEIGSAGASCIAGSIMISDIIPGTGAIHTQSYWNQANQNNAHNWMVQSYTPDEIINLLENNDAQNNDQTYFKYSPIKNFKKSFASKAQAKENPFSILKNIKLNNV